MLPKVKRVLINISAELQMVQPLLFYARKKTNDAPKPIRTEFKGRDAFVACKQTRINWLNGQHVIEVIYFELMAEEEKTKQQNKFEKTAKRSPRRGER